MADYKIENLSFSYPEQEEKTLQNINLSIEQGEFVVLCGVSGCGKTTLLRHLKSILSPHGKKSGRIFFGTNDVTEMSQRDASSKIGFVMQSPENQVVTDKVWHELAFGLESLGLDTPTIRLRVAEMASFFGIQNWFDKQIAELSGGQKQLLNLASIMTMQPEVLILDEPTSQLDPIAASEFLAIIGKINRDLGTTIVMTEHRLDEVLPFANRLLVMEQGEIIADDKPNIVGELLAKKHHSMFAAMPVPMQIYGTIPNDLSCPITVREGRKWLSLYAENKELQAVALQVEKPKNRPIAEWKNVWFRYEKEMSDVLRGFDLMVYEGEFLGIVGGNGVGKTTAFSLLMGMEKPHRGDVILDGKHIENLTSSEIFGDILGVLPQNPQTLFVKKTVILDLYEVLKYKELNAEEKKEKIEKVIKLCGLEGLLERHPYDLSGGEQQRLALAKILLLERKILLLDEPTKGLDGEFKITFAKILNNLLHSGITIVMISHDLEFCAKYTDRLAMVFDGKIVASGTPQTFFGGNEFYTTGANRMARHLLPNAVTPEDVILACGGKIAEETQAFFDLEYKKKQSDFPKNDVRNDMKHTDKRHAFLGIFSLIVLGLTLLFGGDVGTEIATNFYDFGGGQGFDLSNIWTYIVYLFCLLGGTIGFFASFMKLEKTSVADHVISQKYKLSKRSKWAMFMIFLLIPFTIYIGTYFLGSRKYYFIGLLIILEIMLPFALIFEERKPQARELVVIAVLCAIGVAGRSIFFMLPQFKPVVALVILAGVAFGGETGFLVGAMTAFASNMFFGQGPWTPWQMFAFGIIGFLAGALFRKGWLSRNSVSLAIFGGIATFVVYGGIIDVGSYFMYQSVWNPEVFFATLLMGIPFNILHAISTVFFLGILSKPMLEKLERIKIKYGLME